MMKLITFTTILLLCVQLARGQLGCVIGAAPDAVDWFLLYKLPNVNSALHLSSADAAFRAPMAVDHADAGLTRTLNRFLGAAPGDAANPGVKQTMAALAYSNYGPKFRNEIQLTPSKGVILVKTDADIVSSWIVHTIPKFPDISVAALAYTPMPKSALALCMTINNDVIPRILEALTYSDVILYDTYMGSNAAVAAALDDRLIQAFLNGAIPQQSPYVKVNQFTTAAAANAVPITVIGKNQAVSVDVLSRYVALVLRLPLKVRFDTTARDALPNYCVVGNPTSNLPGVITLGGQQIDARDEGALWAVDNNRRNYFCISNAPRTVKQQSLGSTVTCIVSATVYGIFNTAAGTIPNPNLCP